VSTLNVSEVVPVGAVDVEVLKVLVEQGAVVLLLLCFSEGMVFPIH
jgi:hypothetical protein